MATLKRWEKEASKLSLSRAQKLEDCLSEILEWSFFRDEYAEHGIRSVRSILHYRILREKEEIAATLKPVGFGSGEEGAVAGQK